MSVKYKPILSLDFDGTINSYKSGWKGEWPDLDELSNFKPYKLKY